MADERDGIDCPASAPVRSFSNLQPAAFRLRRGGGGSDLSPGDGRVTKI